MYPDNTKEASRQILLVSEFEVRDRLASSRINKFLYQYSSESRPKQSHANMVRCNCFPTKQSGCICCMIIIINVAAPAPAADDDLKVFTGQIGSLHLHSKASKVCYRLWDC